MSNLLLQIAGGSSSPLLDAKDGGGNRRFGFGIAPWPRFNWNVESSAAVLLADDLYRLAAS
jgi:hypothetical protein